MDGFNTSNKGLNPSNTVTKKECKITGVDISDQRKGSKFISAKEVGYEEAHRVRNNDSNPRNNLRRRIQIIKDNPGLFSANDVAVLSPEQMELLSFWEGTKYEINFSKIQRR